MQLHWRFAKNAVANLGRGSAAALVALLLPPILVRHMTAESYAVWVLVLQTAAYASYLSFGLQTAIGRYVAYANEKNDVQQRDSIFSTAFAGLCCAGLLALLCLCAATVAAPAIFPSVPVALIPQMRLALLIVGFAMAAELPASAWNGVLIGMERFEIPALTVGGARLVSAVGVIAAALAGRSLIAMASTIASANLLSYLAQYLALRGIAPDIHFQSSLVERSTARELYGYCLGLTVMSLSMLLVTGFDLVLVGRFEFAAVIPYSVAASMITFISGLLYAVINVVMPHAAQLHAREQPGQLGKLVVSATRLSVLVLVLTGIPILIYARSILSLWIGPQYVAAGAPLLTILIVANIIRLIGAPYAIILIAAGQQQYIKVSPLAEGISNFIASVVLGAFLGAKGVALGTLIGSVVGVAAHLSYSMARTKSSIAFSRRRLLISSVIYPLLWTSPLLALATAQIFRLRISPYAFGVAALVSLVAAGFMSFRSNSFQRDAVTRNA